MRVIRALRLVVLEVPHPEQNGLRVVKYLHCFQVSNWSFWGQNMKTYKRRFQTDIGLQSYSRFAEEVISGIETNTLWIMCGMKTGQNSLTVARLCR